jgi:hypothetical protein
VAFNIQCKCCSVGDGVSSAKIARTSSSRRLRDSDGHTKTLARIRSDSDSDSENSSAARGVHSHCAVLLLIQKHFLDATHY